MKKASATSFLALGAVLAMLATRPVEAAPGPGEIGSGAPEFAGAGQWLNSNPLTMAKLRGKVVLIDFWTYSCINCLRTLPYLAKWYDAYKDKGFVIVGIHTPEFAFERVTRNVQTAIQRFSIKYPVVQDNDYRMWKAYDNHYWPADFLVDQTGKIVAEHFGEGDYDKMEDDIRKLLAAGPPVAPDNGADLSKVGSPEMYFGTMRLQNLASPETPHQGPQTYSAPADVPLNNFALVGNWSVDAENATLAKDQGAIVLHFKSGKAHMVANSASPITVSVTVDGKPQPPVTIDGSRLYTLFDSEDYGEHLLELKIPKAGFQAYTFTFG
jgi:thiol-disulfide isomerase/thioredoxin